jgi:uncharacterized protein HemX
MIAPVRLSTRIAARRLPVLTRGYATPTPPPPRDAKRDPAADEALHAQQGAPARGGGGGGGGSGIAIALVLVAAGVGGWYFYQNTGTRSVEYEARQAAEHAGQAAVNVRFVRFF